MKLFKATFQQSQAITSARAEVINYRRYKRKLQFT